MIKHLLRLLIVLQISSLIYASSHNHMDGLSIRYEWLEPKKLKLSWEPTQTTTQQYGLKLSNNHLRISYIPSSAIPIDQFSLIIDDEVSDVFFNRRSPYEAFPGWSGTPDNSFGVEITGEGNGFYKTLTIGYPQMVAPTTRQVTFETIFPFPQSSIDPQAILSYKNTVANALNITSEEVSLTSFQDIDGGRLQVTTVAEAKIEFADAVEANGGWESRDVWRTICRGGNLGNFTT